MRKIIGFVIAIILVTLTIIFGDHLITKKISTIPTQTLRRYSSDIKFVSPSILKTAIDKNTIPILGSSELTSDSSKPFFLFNIFEGTKTNLLKIGGGGYQSLVQSAILGSIGNDITSKKVVLFISPQWFDEKGLDPAAAISKISLSHVYSLVYNPKLSDDTKTQFIKRLTSLTKDQKSYNEKVSMIFQSYKNRKSLPISIKLDLAKEYEKNRFNLAKNFLTINASSKHTPAKKIPFKKMLLEATNRATSESTNNKMGIESKYYNKHIKPKLSTYKDSNPRSIDLNSVEFDDLKLLYSISNELGLEMEAYSIPVNGQWYDYIGTQKNTREQYYQKINQITKDNNIKLVDLSSHEYDKHFLKDIMHLGEKGWVIIGEYIEKFAQQK